MDQDDSEGTIPRAELAYVEESKIKEFLLNHEHPKGASRARFLGRFGFGLGNWRTLEEALLEHAREAAVVESEHTPYGEQYAIEGELPSPDGRNPRIRSVWLIEPEPGRPRFLTAYPAPQRR